MKTNILFVAYNVRKKNRWLTQYKIVKMFQKNISWLKQDYNKL